MRRRFYLHCVGSLRSLHRLDELVPGFDRYSERALLLAAEGDVVCVSRPVDPEYLAFLGALGLALGYLACWLVSVVTVVIVARRLGVWSAPGLTRPVEA